MLRFLARRLMMMGPMLIGITLVSFLVVHLAPGNPVDAGGLNPKSSAQARENMRKLYGLDKPLHVQYADWLMRTVTLDFGDSLSVSRGKPVVRMIYERLPVTITINVLQLLIIYLVAMPIGIASAVRRNSVFDKSASVLVFLGFSMPSFWLGLLLMILFGVELGWLPISGLESLDAASLGTWGRLLDRSWHLVLIVIVGAVSGFAGISRYIRSNMLEVVKQDYVRTARAKGLSENVVIYKHALRNAMMPVITILGLSIPGLIGGSVILESLFAIPGMGQLLWQSVMARDYPLIMGELVIGAGLTLVGNLMADVSYALVDPRVKLS